MSLYQILKNSYDAKSNQKTALTKYGYNYDSQLSNKNNQIYFNPSTKELLMSVKGTDPTNWRDLYTDAALTFGALKNTSRYKESDKKWKAAKQKYNVASGTLVAHSLGGIIIKYISSSSDKVITLDSASIIGQKDRPNATSYRTSGDLVSLLDANKSNTTTLKKENYGLIDTFGNIGQALSSHEVDQIKNSGINVIPNFQ